MKEFVHQVEEVMLSLFCLSVGTLQSENTPKASPLGGRRADFQSKDRIPVRRGEGYSNRVGDRERERERESPLSFSEGRTGVRGKRHLPGKANNWPSPCSLVLINHPALLTKQHDVTIHFMHSTGTGLHREACSSQRAFPVLRHSGIGLLPPRRSVGPFGLF